MHEKGFSSRLFYLCIQMGLIKSLHGIGTYVFKWAVCLNDGPVPVLGVQLRIIYMVPHPLFGLICIKYYFRWN